MTRSGAGAVASLVALAIAAASSAGSGARRADDRGGPASPVCGSDGHAWPSEGAAAAAGVGLSRTGGCKDGPPSFAPCGAHYCDVATSYCEIVLSDVPDPPTDYACRPLPPRCTADPSRAPSCDCFPAGTRCLSFCGPMDTNGGRPGLHLTCRL